MHICLIGFKGVGKSTIGQQLSERLRRPFFDTDTLLMHSEGIFESIRTCYKHHGEAEFRARESAVIDRLVDTLSTFSIISFGGGSVINEHAFNKLRKQARFIHLFGPVDWFKETRSALFSTEEQKWALYHTRLPGYRALADVEIDVSQGNTVQRIEELYGLQ